MEKTEKGGGVNVFLYLTHICVPSEDLSVGRQMNNATFQGQRSNFPSSERDDIVGTMTNWKCHVLINMEMCLLLLAYGGPSSVQYADRYHSRCIPPSQLHALVVPVMFPAL